MTEQEITGTNQSKMISDWLICFQSRPPWPTRSPYTFWHKLDKPAGQERQPWVSNTTADWKGIPLLSLDLPGWQLFLLGEIASTSGAENFTNPTWQGGSTTASLITTTLRCANRRFLLFAFEQVSHRWHAWTDRFGTLHAYYACDGRRAALGTYAPAVAAAASARKLDWQGLAGFFAMGFFPQDRTHYQDMHILRPSSHYEFDQDGRLLHEERYWEFSYIPDTSRSYDETVDEFACIFQQVTIDQTCSGRVAVPISGGLDSRSTVAALTQKGEPPEERFWGYSYGYSDGSVETRIARQVAAARRLSFQAYTIKSYLFKKLERILSWTEGFQDITQTRQAFVRDELAAHSDALVGALWGDVWQDDMGLGAFSPGSLSDETILHHTMKKMSKRGNAWLLHNLAALQLVREDPMELVKGMVSEELAGLAHIVDPDFRVKAFKTLQWSHRWSLPSQRAYQSAAWPALVFYDHRLVDFFCTVPNVYLSERRLQIDYLKRYAPDLARVPWQVYDAGLYTYQHYNSWLLPKRALKKAWRMIRQEQVIERNWEVQFLCPEGKSGLQRWLLQPGLRLHEFVSPIAIQELLQGFFAAPQPDTGYTVSMLLTFSAWLELHA